MIIRVLRASMFGASLVTGSAAVAQTAPAPCSAPIYNDFDFWLGDWDVTSPDGILQGTNRISVAENGCLIIERWTSVQGGTGQSYNYYDPGTDAWRQIWVSPGATIDYSGGLSETGDMELQGTISYRAGRTAPFKGHWSPQTDGRVIQTFHEQNLETGEWAVWFQGIYTRQGREDE